MEKLEKILILARSFGEDKKQRRIRNNFIVLLKPLKAAVNDYDKG